MFEKLDFLKIKLMVIGEKLVNEEIGVEVDSFQLMFMEGDEQMKWKCWNVGQGFGGVEAEHYRRERKMKCVTFKLIWSWFLRQEAEPYGRERKIKYVVAC